LTGVLRYVMGDDVVLISSAVETANAVYAKLRDADLLNRSPEPGTHRFIASSKQGISGELGQRFLGPEFRAVEYRPWDKP
jgi:glutamate racemase